MPRGDSLGDVVTALVTRHATSVVLVRGSTVMAAQNVLLDMYGSGVSAAETAMVEAASGQAGIPVLKLYGDADLDVQRGDRFAIDASQYRVIIVAAPDTVQRIVYAQGEQL